MGDMTSWSDTVIAEFRESKGTTNYWGPKLVILHMTGARSGEPRVTPVVGFHRDGGWQVVASKGGAPENPDWFYNLVAHPEIEFEALVDGEIETVPVDAHLLADEEPQFGEYLAKTDRRIPVFQLSRR
jgi:deazaflavin-dependent oxidoreductase (nitroreductase family)